MAELEERWSDADAENATLRLEISEAHRNETAALHRINEAHMAAELAQSQLETNLQKASIAQVEAAREVHESISNILTSTDA